MKRYVVKRVRDGAYSWGVGKWQKKFSFELADARVFKGTAPAKNHIKALNAWVKEEAYVLVEVELVVVARPVTVKGHQTDNWQGTLEV